MTKVSDIVKQIEKLAPLKLQEDYDNAGYQVAFPDTEVSGVLTCLDVDENTIDEAIERNAQLILSHHPLLFKPLRKVTLDDYISRTVIKAIKAGISIYSAHTNLDNAYQGVNYKMAEILGLNDVKPLASLPSEKLIGVENAEMCGSGIIGNLAEALSETEFLNIVKTKFKCDSLAYNSTKKTVKRVALCGGAGAEFVNDAIRQKADAFLTGEMRYHEFFGHEDILLISAGHFETEQYTCNLLADYVSKYFPEVVCKVTSHHADPVKYM